MNFLRIRIFFHQGSRIRSLFHLLDSFRSFIKFFYFFISRISTLNVKSERRSLFFCLNLFLGLSFMENPIRWMLFYPSVINIPFLCTSFERFRKKPEILSYSENLKTKKKKQVPTIFLLLPPKKLELRAPLLKKIKTLYIHENGGKVLVLTANFIPW